MILVTGATGKVGSETVRLLRQNSLPVRALVRDPDKAKASAEAGAEIARGDLAVSSTIDDALRGVNAVVLVSPGTPDLELTVIQSALDAGVGHVVKVSSGGAAEDSPIARRRWHAQIEQGLVHSGLNYTLLRPNAYMQNVLAAAAVIANTSTFANSQGTGLVGMIDAGDVAAVAAAVIAEPIAHRGRTYTLSGPELISQGDVARILSRVLGRQITYVAVGSDEDIAAMTGAGLPAPVAEMNAQAFKLVADGGSAWVTDDVAAILGRPPRSFEEFAIDNLRAFQ